MNIWDDMRAMTANGERLRAADILVHAQMAGVSEGNLPRVYMSVVALDVAMFRYAEAKAAYAPSAYVVPAAFWLEPEHLPATMRDARPKNLPRQLPSRPVWQIYANRGE